MIIQAGIVRIVFNMNYDSVLSKHMLAMTNIEIVQINPDSGVSITIKKRLPQTDLLQLQEQFSSPSPLTKRFKSSHEVDLTRFT